MTEPLFVPEGTSLSQQLINFQKNKRRMAIVVDEYGEVLGIITLADLLEEIVGEFTTDESNKHQAILKHPDGGYYIDGSINIRELNKYLDIDLPTEGPKTLSGLIIEHLETIPLSGTCILINHYPIEVITLKDNTVRTAKLMARLPYQSSFSV